MVHWCATVSINPQILSQEEVYVYGVFRSYFEWTELKNVLYYKISYKESEKVGKCVKQSFGSSSLTNKITLLSIVISQYLNDLISLKK